MNLYTATMNLCTTTISLIESEVNCLSYVDIMKHSKFVGRWVGIRLIRVTSYYQTVTQFSSSDPAQ